MKYYCFFDGGCVNNGQLSAKAYGSCLAFPVPDSLAHPVEINPKYWEVKNPILKHERFAIKVPGRVSTNNIAEAKSLHFLVANLYLHSILRLGNEVFIFGDSQLIINQVQGIWKVRSPELAITYRKIHGIFRRFKRNYKCPVGRILTIDAIPGDLMKQIIGH